MQVPETSKTRKIVISVLAVLLLVVSAFGLLDRKGEQYVKDGWSRAVIAFGISGVINGVISVAQGTELSVQPVGVGVNLAPGQILDPANDLIELFSTVMVFSLASFGVQELLLKVVSSNLFIIISSVVLLILIINEWFVLRFLPGWFNRALIIFLIVRLAVPVMSITSEGFYHLFLKSNYEQSIEQLESASNDIEKLNKEDEAEADADNSILGQAKKIFKSTSDSVNFSKKFESYKQAAARISNQVVDMIVVFIVQTVLLPILFLWLVIRFCEKLISR